MGSGKQRPDNKTILTTNTSYITAILTSNRKLIVERYHLGEFEEILLLTIAVLDNHAYGVAIKDEIFKRLNRRASIGGMQTALRRLERKGYLTSSLGDATKVRGGKRKRFYQVTALGYRAIAQTNDARQSLWNDIVPNLFST